MPRRRKTARYYYLLAPLSGAVLALGQVPWGFFWLAPLAFWGLLRLLDSPRPVFLFWLAGLGYFGLALNWIVEPFLVDPERYGWMAPFGLIFMAGGMALFWMLAGWIAKRLGGGPFALALALAFVAILRGHVLTGFPWATPGYALVNSPFAQIAAWIGPWGLNFLFLLAAAWVASLRWREMVSGALLILAVGAFGVLRTEPVETGLMIRMVQPNAAQDQKWDPGMADVFAQRLFDGTRGAEEAAVIWPETAVHWLLGRDDRAFASLSSLTNAPIVLGANRSDGQNYYNSLFVVDEAMVGQVYDKQHLTPFGEYMPYGETLAKLGLRGLAEVMPGGFTPGSRDGLINLPNLPPAAPAICYEAIFPGELRARMGDAGWIIHSTNDAWFGTRSGPYQHLAQAQMRAIELGVPVARAANTGVSAMIDPYGRVMSSLDLGDEGFFTARLPEALGKTPYRRFGDWPIYAGLAGLAFYRLTRRRRKR
ncbi:apolipoprotein N-acyltransferase [Paracoccaceae bacterium GXU_MW_L88]